jgi:hypothetical protein
VDKWSRNRGKTQRRIENQYTIQERAAESQICVRRGHGLRDIGPDTLDLPGQQETNQSGNQKRATKQPWNPNVSLLCMARAIRTQAAKNTNSTGVSYQSLQPLEERSPIHSTQQTTNAIAAYSARFLPPDSMIGGQIR